MMSQPKTGLENIVQLPQTRRTSLPRPQAVGIVPFESWVAARDRVAGALLGGTRRLLVTGPAGTGKTVLLDHVARLLRAAGRSVSVQLADAEPAPPAAEATLFVDEADRLAPAQLRALLAADGVVVLAGLGAALQRQVKAAVTVVALEPVGREGARDYIAAWLGQTGRSPADLDSAAVRRLFELSGGVPRLLSVLLSASAWVAATGGAPSITAAHVEEAAELRSVLTPAPRVAVAPQRRRPWAWAALLAGLVVLGAAGAVASRLFPGATAQAWTELQGAAGRAERWAQLRLRGPLPAPVAPAGRAALTMAPVPAELPAPAAPVLAAPERAVVPAVALAETPPAQAAHSGASAHEVVSAEHEAAPPSQALPVETQEILLRRGREMLQLADISAARLLFRRAADGGSAEAMLELGHTYDPAFLRGIGAGAMADPAEMARWLHSAEAAGSR